MRLLLIVVSLLGLVQSVSAQTSKATRIVLKLADSSIIIRVYGHEHTVLYVHLHENEIAARQVAEAAVDTHGGRLISLHQHGKRNAQFILKGKRYRFDPNRIFTPRGRKLTLRMLNHGVPPRSTMVVLEQLAAKIIALLQSEDGEYDAIVAMHNNTPGGFSIKSYEAGGTHAVQAEAVHVNASRNPDEFYVVTSRTLFNELRLRNANVVLQSAAATADDGSLSVYAIRHGLHYINVEARHGDTVGQKKLLETLLQ